MQAQAGLPQVQSNVILGEKFAFSFPDMVQIPSTISFLFFFLKWWIWKQLVPNWCIIENNFLRQNVLHDVSQVERVSFCFERDLVSILNLAVARQA